MEIGEGRDQGSFRYFGEEMRGEWVGGVEELSREPEDVQGRLKLVEKGKGKRDEEGKKRARGVWREG